MCGITGIIDFRRQSGSCALELKVRAMIDRIRYRGPDGIGVWVEPKWGVALGFCRLSILDLSAAGMQPMISADGRYIIVFNGEIYNHSTLRARVNENYSLRWRSRCDAESLLESIAAFGLDQTLRDCEGMYGFACFDTHSGSLTLVRDRFGEKSVYFGERDGFLAFGSELGTLEGLGQTAADIDFDAVGAYLRHTYVPAPSSIWKNVRKLEAGTYCKWNLVDSTPVGMVYRYWDATAAAIDARESGSEGSLLSLERVIELSVEGKLQADVPVGVFLSGGIDSSLIAWKAAEISRTQVQAFCVSFPVAGYDESDYARAIAKDLGLHLQVVDFGENECLDAAVKLPELVDEPFADTSYLPLLQLARVTRRSVKVALTGDAGDELFCGYERYRNFATRMRFLRGMGPIGRLGLRIGGEILKRPWLERVIGRDRGYSRNPNTSSHGVSSLARTFLDLADGDSLHVYRAMTSFWKEPREICSRAGDGRIAGAAGITRYRFSDKERAQLFDMGSYLPNEILIKTDRATMNAGLEARCPFLDTKVYAEAWRIPAADKMNAEQGKLPLRNLLERRFPKAYFNRKKAGFTVPISKWLRGKLRSYAEEVIFQEGSAEHAVLDRTILRGSWQRHLSERCDNSAALWTAIHLEKWLKHALARQAKAGGYLIKRDLIA